MRDDLPRFVADVVAQARGPVAADRKVQARLAGPGWGQVAAGTRNEANATMKFFTLDFDALDDTSAELA